MNNFNAEFWDERYNQKDYLYGLEPNVFFKSQIVKYRPGNLFLPGDGDGRNSVYAASLGWKVDTVDFSTVAIEKAKKFANSFRVKINHYEADLSLYNPKINYYDAAGLIFVHLPPSTRKNFHTKLINSLAPSGILIVEVFEKKQLGKTSGGPQSEEMLYSVTELENDFKDLQTIYLNEELVELKESEKHFGEANVIRYVGMKLK